MSAASSFVRGILFAALAAALWLPWAVAVGPVVGMTSAVVVYLIGATAAYVASVAVQPARRVLAAVLVAAAAMAVAIVAPTKADLALGLALVIGVARAVLYPGAAVRVILRETLLLVGGLLVARFLAAPSLVSVALALWGFLLVQSFFFLGGARRATSRSEGDGFEEARRRALAVLDRQPG